MLPAKSKLSQRKRHSVFITCHTTTPVSCVSVYTTHQIGYIPSTRSRILSLSLSSPEPDGQSHGQKRAVVVQARRRGTVSMGSRRIER
jgi:hypothetical protein